MAQQPDKNGKPLAAGGKPRVVSSDLSSFYSAGPSGPNQPGWNNVPNSRAANIHRGGNFLDIMDDYDPRPRHQTQQSQQAQPRPFQVPPPVYGQPTMQPIGSSGIMRPMNASMPSVSAAPQPIYSSRPGGVIPSNAQWATGKGQRMPINDFVDLTREDAKQRQKPLQDDDDEDAFNPHSALEGGKFGDFDPSNFMDSAQTNENIQKLLEGAFEEDEDDKPKAKLRQRKTAARVNDDSAADRLASKLQQVDLKKDQEKSVEPEEEEEDDGSVEGLKVKLLPHQIDGVSWMLDKEIGERKRNGVLPKGGILADDMGLGKTIQALSLILSNPRPTAEWIAANPKKKFPAATGKGTLVVAPLALIKQWEAEIKDKVTKEHKLKVLVHHGPSRTKSFEDLKNFDVVITTYQTLTSEHDGSSPEDNGLKAGVFGVQWLRVILDEAHSIKNRNAKMTKAAYELRSVYRWCLTGTPMQNNLDELQSLVRFLRIKPYADLKAWKDQIGGPMKSGRGGLAMKRLQYFLKAFMKRRTKDVLKQSGALKFGKAKEGEEEDENREGFKIVAREVQTVETDFSERERAIYDRLQQRTERSLDAMMGGERKDYIGALVMLLRLRQLCNHPDLIKGNLKQEASHDGIGSGGAKEASKRGKDDVDDMADLFGGLSVETKKCDICQAVLSKDESAAGNIRCGECEADVQENDQSRLSDKTSRKIKGRKLHRRKKHSIASPDASEAVETKAIAKPSRRQRKVVDSDDEDEDDDNGEWIVSPSQQGSASLGKAGGKDDEDAEGGGDWTRSDEERSADDDDDDDNEQDNSFISKDEDNRRYFSSSSSSASDDDDEDDEVPRDGALASTKIKHLLDILARETPTDKVIVFSEFTSMLDLIQPHLHAAHIAYARYDGKMANADREASLHALRSDARVRVLLCSLRCGALGLNLTAASRIVLMEPFWNPFVEEQAIDRVHRLNQPRDVRVFRLTVRATVEERILALQQKKRELARAAIEGGAAAKGKMNLSMADVLALFRRDARDVDDRDDAAARALGAHKVPVLSPAKNAAPVSAPVAGEPKHRVVSGPGAGRGKSPFDAAYGRRW